MSDGPNRSSTYPNSQSKGKGREGESAPSAPTSTYTASGGSWNPPSAGSLGWARVPSTSFPVSASTIQPGYATQPYNTSYPDDPLAYLGANVSIQPQSLPGAATTSYFQQPLNQAQYTTPGYPNLPPSTSFAYTTSSSSPFDATESPPAPGTMFPYQTTTSYPSQASQDQPRTGSSLSRPSYRAVRIPGRSDTGSSSTSLAPGTWDPNQLQIPGSTNVQQAQTTRSSLLRTSYRAVRDLGSSGTGPSSTSPASRTGYPSQLQVLRSSNEDQYQTITSSSLQPSYRAVREPTGSSGTGPSSTSPASGTPYPSQFQVPGSRNEEQDQTIERSSRRPSYQAVRILPGSTGQQGLNYAPAPAPVPGSTNYQAFASVPSQGAPNVVVGPQQSNPSSTTRPGGVRSRTNQPGQGVFQAVVSSSSTASVSSQAAQASAQDRFSLNPPEWTGCRCKVSFAKSEMSRHWRTACPDNPSREIHQCNVCGETFARRDTLRRHMKAHSPT
ncbi:hypothetical protein M407DRAFT_8089 [Tulasnella calospora MUT 4182]|uniref:C2H2-type domain-containing protein n=1 Tax=Tulasnella calospora MUT 4182 TaxID=1051891 RepID=A0A0C3L8T6_9AGAM|nr:hypothetical protein M407DRAFT_12172 [Tulasnella calospora MUT 4182]KIO26011.1 hypothetical protein M407DRAFT_8089 [Tulasnella calospora MUT 4182]